jgi:ATP-dependent RNA helicase DeaD
MTNQSHTSIKTFNQYPLHDQIQKNLAQAGLTNPTEIQEKAFQSLLSATGPIDFHGQAQTGTGKTLAFGIPLIQGINQADSTTQALIVAPTRELVLQICDSLKVVARNLNVVVEPIYGGVSIENQMRQLKRGVQIVVGTPGRLNDHLRRKTLNLKTLKTLVLDEADIMLDMGFKEEIDEIMAFAPKNRQIWLFSATVKPGIKAIKDSHMKDPVSVRVAAANVTAESTKQYFCIVPRKSRMQALARFIDTEPDFYGVIFCQTKMLANDVSQELSKLGYSVNALHGDINQVMRNKVIKEFKAKAFTILVATDVAARGIDVANLTHVVNFSLPEDAESYVHRIGRTGRAGKEGVAITFVNGTEVRRLQQIANRFKAQIMPLEVPTTAAIAKLRLAKAMEQIDHLCVKKIADHACSEQLHALLKERSQEELVIGLHNLISETLLKGCSKEQENIQFESTARALEQTHRFDAAGQEIMLNVGSDDGITKKDILGYLKGARSLKPADIGRVHVIKRRSFIVVPNDVAPTLLKELTGKTLKGRRVFASMAQNPN